MPVTSSEIEELVTAACRDFRTQEIPNMKATARKHGAPPGRGYRRWNCLAESRIDAGGANKVLDDAAEQALCLHIDFADQLDIPIREKTLTKAANSILRNRHSGDSPRRVISAMWPSRWLNRHQEYKKRALKPLATSQKNSHDPAPIEKWFQKLLAVKQEYGIFDNDTYNMDETGFRIGVGRKYTVIPRAGNKRPQLRT
jgi:hypothetical protein